VTLRAVLFDAGNTLLFLDYPRLASAVGAALGWPLAADDLARQAKPAAQALERGETSDRERATAYLETLFLLAGVPEQLLGTVRDTLLQLHREKHLWGALAEGTDAALHRLATAGYHLGVVSNSDGRVEEALVAAGIRHHFQVVVDSQLVGVEKPDPRIFISALDALGCRPSEALYVGDIYEVDVVGARRAGMDVVLIDPEGSHTGRDVRTFRNVAEVAEVVVG
jgi:putative hydrolase of the HAD superfamily